MENIVNSLKMGEYGVYVWTSFAVAALVIIAMFIVAVRALKTAKNIFKNLQNTKD